MKTEKEAALYAIDCAHKRHYLAGFRKHQLVWWLEERGSNPAGTKGDLIDRILKLKDRAPTD